MRRVFLDTNVLVYVFDKDEPAKQAQATHIFQALVEEGRALLSTQVLQEFYAVSTGKLRSPLTLAEAGTALEAFARLPVVMVTPDVVLGAARLHRSDSVSFWDALIVQAALSAGADVLYSEDLQHGRRFGGLRIENPFLGEESLDAEIDT
ncbi:MAG: PIN domain-containing protein [Thermoleophilia bacterium]